MLCAYPSAYDPSAQSMVRLLQPSKASSPMLITLEGIEIVLSNEQPEKASSPIDDVPFGMLTLLRLEQPLNAPIPIVSRLDGNDIEFSEEHSEKASCPIFVTPFGILTAVTLLPEKAPVPIAVM